ncbi:hypothetical protein DAI22_06g000033 [Oryza sativa Japonica Group]|nr:hypothetical protein DAI22_06g000033 [Oryza sativa Japonica Group]
MIDAHLFRDYHLAFWYLMRSYRFGLFCAWGQPQDGDLHLWLPHQCRCHLGTNQFSPIISSSICS